MAMQLSTYSKGDYNPGASFWKQILWYFFGTHLLSTRLIPLSSFKIFILRLFGAQVGNGVRIKPGVQIKFPWRLKIGAYSWIGENVWIDNLAFVEIGANCCLSQGAYLCTGSHDWSKSSFDLITKPITVKDHAWLAAKSLVAPGVEVKEGAILAMGSLATTNLEAWSVYQGVPATLIKQRKSK